MLFEHNQQDYHLDCDYIVGADGFHGVAREAIPNHLKTEYEKTFPVGWLGVMVKQPPVNDHLIYAKSKGGFALVSIRNSNLSRYYVQVPITDRIEDWSDEKFWRQFATRLPKSVREDLKMGQSIEKSIAPLRSFVCEPLSYGRMFLVGDAGHIVPPTGAKGLNLAASDVYSLYQVMMAIFLDKNPQTASLYSLLALRRVWNGVRFSWQMTNTLHKFSDSFMSKFDQRIYEEELNFYLNNETGQKLLAQQYVGLPYEQL